MFKKQNSCCITMKRKEQKLIKQRFSSFHIINQLDTKRTSSWKHSSTRSIGMLVWSTGVHYSMSREIKCRKSSMMARCPNKKTAYNLFLNDKIVVIRETLKLINKVERWRKKRVEELKMNTLLLWRLACNYGEKKMQFVWKMMNEYSSAKIERKLFSFNDHIHDTTRNILTYRFVRNSLHTNKNKYNITSEKINTKENEIISTSSLDTIEKLTQHLDLIQEKLESFRKHLNGIHSDADTDIHVVDNNNIDKTSGTPDPEGLGIRSMTPDASISNQGAKVTNDSDLSVSYENTIARPMDNIEWNLNVAELEVINLLLEIKRGLFENRHIEDITVFHENKYYDYDERSPPFCLPDVALCKSSTKKRRCTSGCHFVEVNVPSNDNGKKRTISSVATKRRSNVRSSTYTIPLDNKKSNNESQELECTEVSKQLKNGDNVNGINSLPSKFSSLNNFVLILRCNSVNETYSIKCDFCCVPSIGLSFRLNPTFNTVNIDPPECDALICSADRNRSELRQDRISRSVEYFTLSGCTVTKSLYDCKSNDFSNGTQENTFSTPVSEFPLARGDKQDEFLEKRRLRKKKILDFLLLNGCFAGKLRSRDLSLDAIIRKTNETPVSINSIMKLNSKAFALWKNHVMSTANAVTKKSRIADDSFQECIKNSKNENIHVFEMENEKDYLLESENEITRDCSGLLSQENICTSSCSCVNLKSRGSNSSCDKTLMDAYPYLKSTVESEKMFDLKRVNNLTQIHALSDDNNKTNSNMSTDITDLRAGINKNCQKIKDISFHFDRLNEKFDIRAKQNDTDLKKIYEYIYSLQDKFTTGLTLVIDKMNCLARQENDTKVALNSKIEKNCVCLKKSKKSLECLKLETDSKLVLNDENCNKMATNLTSVKHKFRSLIKLHSYQINKGMEDTKLFQKNVDLKLKCALYKIGKISSTFTYDKLCLHKMIDENRIGVEEAINNFLKMDLQMDDKIKDQANVIDGLTDRIENMQSSLCKTTVSMEKNLAAIEKRLHRLENNEAIFQNDRDEMQTELNIVKSLVYVNQDELEVASNGIRNLSDELLENKQTINTLFQEINQLKKKFDIELRTQHEVNKYVDSSLESLSRTFGMDREIGENEIKKFTDTIKRNTTVSTASCNNLRMLSDQMDTTVLYVQTKIERILMNLNVSPNTGPVYNVHHSSTIFPRR